MSAAQAVEDAITAAVQAENPGAIVTGYALVIEATVPDDVDSTAFIYDAAPGQSVATTVGLLDLGHRHHLGRIGDGG